jgi:GNAT superfamily N-acetyltransferase
MSDRFVVRRATLGDAAPIARHRAEMFRDMGQLPGHLYSELVEQTIRYLEEALPAEEYVGWLASSTTDARTVVGGAGVQVRRTLPHPLRGESGERIAVGRQAIVLNVFTERNWRRQGVAALMMRHAMEWARCANVDTLVLHASQDGRALYERLGFIPTTEMRYPKL